MGTYPTGPTTVLTRLYPYHNFERDARMLPMGQMLIEVTSAEIPTSPLADEKAVKVLSHAEALETIRGLRAATGGEPPVPADDDEDDDR